MQTKVPLTKVMLYQSLGFLAIIALGWFVEFTDLHRWVLGNHPYISDFRESALEMLLVLGVWMLVAGSTRRILAHVRQLEGFLRLCSWCHHVDHNGNWIPLEEFLERGFETPTTHGICPKCLKEQLAAIEGHPAVPPEPENQADDSLPLEWRRAADKTKPPST